MRYLFIDEIGYKPYTGNTLNSEPLGGSEASLIRVTEGLAKRGHDVSVYQSFFANHDTQYVNEVRYIGFDSQIPTPEIVVCFRTAKNMGVWKNLFPTSRHYMWTQDLGGSHLSGTNLAGQDIIALTAWHEEQFRMAAFNAGEKIKSSRFIYNPVDARLEHAVEKIKNRLGFFSAPIKGLSQVLTCFSILKKEMPDLELVVANPGYIKDALINSPGVTQLGQLPHPAVLTEMAKCAVLFYPQTVFPETFGIVLAEANGLGVPVLCHKMGAASEVLGGTEINHRTNAVIDCTDLNKIVQSLTTLMTQTDKPSLDPKFLIESVVEKWEAL